MLQNPKIRRSLSQKPLFLITRRPGAFRPACRLLLLALFLMPSLLYADEYFASIGTSTGSYDVTVEVEDGKVTKIYWPRGVSMNVSNAELNYEGLAKGQNSAGEDIVIEVIGYEG